MACVPKAIDNNAHSQEGDSELMRIHRFFRRLGVPLIGAMLLGACATTAEDGSSNIGNLPDGVVALAGPGQDLTTARFRADDGCYWYEHNGPVETTMIPLRTTDGNRICVAGRT